jgi:hypothetical protein
VNEKRPSISVSTVATAQGIGQIESEAIEGKRPHGQCLQGECSHQHAALVVRIRPETAVDALSRLQLVDRPLRIFSGLGPGDNSPSEVLGILLAVFEQVLQGGRDQGIAGLVQRREGPQRLGGGLKHGCGIAFAAVPGKAATSPGRMRNTQARTRPARSSFIVPLRFFASRFPIAMVIIG